MKDNRIKKIYKDFTDNVGFTIKCSATISLCLILIYLIFASIIIGVGEDLMFGFFGMLLSLLCVSFVLGLVTPFIYSFFAINGALHTPKAEEIGFKNFMRTYIIGRAPQFKKQLNIWNTLLNSVLILMGLNLLGYLVIMLVAQIGGTELNDVFVLISQIDPLSSDYANQVNIILNDHIDLINAVSLHLNFASILPTVFYFVHTVCMNTLKYYPATTPFGMNSRLCTYIHRQVIRNNRKGYYGFYYKALWPILILFLGSFATTYYCLAYFGPENISITILSLTSTLVSIVVTLPFMPLVFNVHEAMWPTYEKTFLTIFNENAQRELAYYKQRASSQSVQDQQNINIAEKNIEKLKEMLDKENNDAMDADVTNEKDVTDDEDVENKEN